MRTISESSGSARSKPGMPASGMPSWIRLRTASSEFEALAVRTADGGGALAAHAVRAVAAAAALFEPLPPGRERLARRR